MPVASYRWLNSWAERDQRRFEQRRSRPPSEPGTEPTALRIIAIVMATFGMGIKAVTLPMFVIWAVALLVQHTVRSVVLAVAVLMVASMSAFTTAAVIHARREHGRNWFTGLPPRRPRDRR